ncbi:MAG: hypothetical protein AB8F74_19135 [Saprospiraceae bacterium]
MRIKILFFLIFFIINLISVKAQLKKGDFYSSSNAEVGYNFQGPNNKHQFTQQLELNNRWMISKYIMLGGGFEIDNGSTLTNNFVFGYVEPYFLYEFSTEVRAYFSTKKIAPYIYINGAYSQIRFSTPFPVSGFNLDDDSTGFFSSKRNKQSRRIVDLGFGLDFFISPNVVLETRLGWNIYKKGEFNFQSTDERELYLNSGFALLFRRADERASQPLIERYLKTGNILSQGNLSFRSPIGSENELLTISMLVENSYFVSNQTEVTLKSGYDYFRFKGFYGSSFSRYTNIRNSTLNMGLSLRHYFRLNNNLFLAPAIGVDIISQRDNNTEPNLTTTTFPLTIDLVYFKNQSRYFLGSTYRHSRNDNHQRQNNQKFHSYDARLGFDYFFRPSIYLRSQLNVLLYTDLVEWEAELPELKDNLRRVNLSFTFGFMINS